MGVSICLNKVVKKKKQLQNVEERTRWIIGRKVQNFLGASGGSCHELRRQHRCQKSVRDFCGGFRQSIESDAGRRRRRHGHGFSEKGKARTEKEGDSRGGNSSTETLSPKGRCHLVLRRQCRRHRQ